MSKDDAAWVNVAYVVFFLLSSYVVFKAMETIGIQTGWVERFGWFHLAQMGLGVVLGAGFTLYLRRDKERHDYFVSAVGELRKVSWPTWVDTKRMTLIVGMVVGIFAVIVSVFDLIWAKILKFLIA